MPLLLRGEPIVAAFKATYPPEVLVYDQPIIDGAITIERAISDGPGWMADYNEIEGQPGFIIGNAPLEDGLNEQVRVELLEAAITTQLFARLHHDTEPGDAFNFPGQDPPVRFNNRLPRAAAFRTDSGAHVFVSDQRVGDDGALSIDVVVSPVPAWVAIYDDNEGQPGDLLGRAWVPPGINRNVIIETDSPPDPGIAHLALYEDLGQPEEFEGAGVDPLLVNDDNRSIRVPFTIRPEIDS
jgi:hypothetical protein